MSIRKKFLVVLVIGIIGFLTIIVIFSKLGRSGIDEDPFLGNPQVRVMDEIMDWYVTVLFLVYVWIISENICESVKTELF